MSNEVYICATPYHVLITLAKLLACQGKPADVALFDTMPNAPVLCDRIRKCACVDRVFLLKIRELEEEQAAGRMACLYMLFHRHHVRDNFDFLRSYPSINMFNDVNVCAWYFAITHTKYHLIEDGLDTFKVFNQYSLRGRNKLTRWLICFILRMPVAQGWSSSCVDVEVNDSESLRTHLRRPVKAVSRDELLSSIDEAGFQELFYVFGGCDIQSGEDALLVLTQPLMELDLVETDDEQARFYIRLASHMGYDEYYVKPHPRDTADYRRAQGFDGILIDAPFPVELLNYSDVRFGAAVTYSSTALRGMTCAKRRYACDSSLVGDGIEQCDGWEMCLSECRGDV